MTAEKKIFFWDTIDFDDAYDEAFDYINSKGVSINKGYEASVVFEELFTNAMKYAKTTLTVIIESDKESVSLLFIDFGNPFDPTKYISSSSFSLIGGHGLELVKAYSNSFKYERAIKINCTEAVFSKSITHHLNFS